MTNHPKVLARISRAALENNYRIIEKHTGKPQICVVKADCYGHGVECAGVFYDCGCRVFAVSGTDEALVLRDFFNGRGQHPDILIFGYVNPTDVPELIENDVICAVFSREFADLCVAHVPAGKRLRAHIKINSGMNRIGFSNNELGDALYASRLPQLSIEGIFTHFACADEPEEQPTLDQIARFDAAVSYLTSHGVSFCTVHAYNSAAGIRFTPKYDAVRSGIVLYGLRPSDCCGYDGLIPAMQLITYVAQVHVLPKGERVSYGWEFCADRDITLATLPIGYADGYIRAYKNGYALINGEKAPIVGRICMDQLMVDVSGIPGVKCGDEALMMGGDGVSADELAAAAHTINYEVTCLISKRVGRVLV
ncbi:MAG: alanine racemase [Clostridia bacterium]|nr:alanine racemase [Clostridia bacterium]